MNYAERIRTGIPPEQKPNVKLDALRNYLRDDVFPGQDSQVTHDEGVITVILDNRGNPPPDRRAINMLIAEGYAVSIPSTDHKKSHYTIQPTQALVDWLIERQLEIRLQQMKQYHENGGEKWEDMPQRIQQLMRKRLRAESYKAVTGNEMPTPSTQIG